jgi:hypothetical protein
VILGRQLLRVESESSNHLLGQNTGCGIPERIERDLANQGVIGHHHCDWSEQGFEVVGQL